MNIQRRSQHFKIYNYNGTKIFNEVCSKIKSLNYAKLEYFRYSTVLHLNFNNKNLQVRVYNSWSEEPNPFDIIYKSSSENQYKKLVSDEELQSFYLEQNIKEKDFADFMTTIPSTQKNGHFIYNPSLKVTL